MYILYPKKAKSSAYSHYKVSESTGVWLQIPALYIVSLPPNLLVLGSTLHKGVCCLAISLTRKYDATIVVYTVVQFRDEPAVQDLFCLIKYIMKY